MPTYEICMNASAPSGAPRGQQGKWGISAVSLPPLQTPLFHDPPSSQRVPDPTGQTSCCSALHLPSFGRSFADPGGEWVLICLTGRKVGLCGISAEAEGSDDLRTPWSRRI